MKCPTCTTELPVAAARCPACTTPLMPRELRPAAAPVTARTPGHNFPPGQVFAERYRIVRQLGRGGMGEVYQAEDLKLGQTVALKFLPHTPRTDARRHALLLNEVRLARRIAHHRVCQIFDVVESGGFCFLSMEYIDGEDLARLMKRVGRLPEERALVLSLEMCHGLEAAHRRGILHRDLKPDNVMLDSAGHIRIMDFGLASIFGPGAAEQDSSITARHAGTPAYMAPELLAGHHATVQSDLYALGLVFYQLFTGHRAVPAPPRGTSAGAEPRVRPVAPSHWPVAPSRWVDGLSSEVEQIILSSLKSDPRLRPVSAGEVAAVFEHRAMPPWHPASGIVVPQRPAWRLEKKLGEGGFGEAWRARSDATREHRVFKICHDARHLQALKREITLFRLLKEELGERRDINRILDWNLDEPPWFVESEFVQGGDLSAWAEGKGGLGNVPLETRLDLVAQVATALAAAHSIGVLHKDVKPSNVLIDETSGRPCAQLADFGLGMVLEHGRLERAGITVLGFTAATEAFPSSYAGTRLYMAPEVLEGRGVTVHADIYALGVVLYQMIVGDFSRTLAPGWERDVSDELLARDIAAAVDGRPERRPGSARLAERLRTLPERRAARRAAAATRVALARSRRRWRLGVAGTAVALLVAALTLFQARQINREAARKVDNARLAVAGGWLHKDPTRAALVLLEVEDIDRTPSVGSRMREALNQELAFFELRGHDQPLQSATWSPDGSRILTASEDGTARTWRAADGRCLSVLKGHEDVVLEAAWSPDGASVATASFDGTARIWNLATGTPLVLRGHEGRVFFVAWSADGGQVVTTSEDETARIWNVRDGSEAFVLSDHQGLVRMAAWSPDGRRLATTADDGKARVWELDATAQPTLAHVLPHPGQQAEKRQVWMVAWSPDGKRLVTAPNNLNPHVWSLGDSQPIVLGEAEHRVRMAEWSPNGQFLATASEDGVLRLWPGDTNGEDEPREFSGHEGWVWSLRWHPDSKRLLTTSNDATAYVWFVGRGDQGGGRLLWDLGDSILLKGHGAHVEMGDWSPDGERAVTASADGTARIWRPGSAGAAVLLGHGAVHARAWSADGRSPDGTRVLTISDSTIRIQTVSQGSEGTVSLTGHQARIYDAAWSHDSQRIATVSEDSTVRMWDEKGELDSVRSTRSPIHSVAWSREDTHLVVGLANGNVLVWRADAAARKKPLVLKGHRLKVHRIVFSHGGEKFATAADPGGEVLVWDFESLRAADSDKTRAEQAGEALSPRPQVVLEGHRDRVEVITWSLDGRYLTTASRDGTTRIWQLDIADLRDSLAAATRVCLDPEFRKDFFEEAAAEAQRRYDECALWSRRVLDTN